MFWKNRNKQRTPFLFEELESRVLFSADGLGALIGVTDVAGEIPAAHVLVVDSDFKVGPAATERGLPDQGSASTVQQRLELVFVDSNTPDHELLVGDLLGREDENRRFEVIMLDANRDGIEQITDVLGQYNGIDGVHIVSHGNEGQVQLGNTTLSADKLTGYRSEFMLWGAALGNDADILIYGCDLAATDTGQSLVNSLADITGADVAASEDLTGNALLGGDWDLEYTTGAIESGVAFSAAAQQNWAGVLGSIAVTTTADVLDGDADTSSLAALAIAPGSDGLVSLREAVIAANTGSGADTIVLGAGTYTLSIAGTAEDVAATGDLDIRDGLTIRGAGAGQTIIDGNNAHRIFHVIGSSVINVSISDVKIQNGFTSDPTDNKGAGLHINNVPAVPVVSLTNVWFSGNRTSGGGDSGGAVFNGGDLSLENVLIEGNSSLAGGGVMNSPGGTLSMTNVTLSGNSATAGDGGGLANFQTATLQNVTITNNTASGAGGGVYNHDPGGAITNINNTLVANNIGATNYDLHGAFVSDKGDNLIKVAGTATGLNGSDITGIDPRIGALADNGGSTMTHALLAGSQAIDKGTVAGAPSSDQRGKLREGAPDIGAFEYVALKLAAVDEFRVNTTTTAIQETSGVNRGSHRAVAVDGAGNSIVVWSDSARDGNGWGVFAQRFDSAGNRLGSEFQVNINSSNDERRATVAADETGRFVIAFTASDGDQTGIYLRRFNANGAAIDAADVLVNAGQTAGGQYNPSVAVNNAGDMVIAWQSDGASEGIYARQFNMTSAAPGDQLPTPLITVEGGATADEASVDINNSGRYVVTWTQDSDLYGRRYDYATASALSARHDLNVVRSSTRQAVVAVQEDNDFVIAYRSDQSALEGVWVRQFRDNGSAYPITRQVISGANAVSPSIDMATNGDFIVVYENDDAAGTGVFARRYDAALAPQGGEFQVNTSTTLNQHQASIAVVDLDNFVVAWSGTGDQPGQQDASGGVFARQYGNDAPTATNLTSTSPYNEGDASVAIADIVVSDVDTGETITATLTLANTATGSLSANDGATYTAATGVWTITGTVANVNTALANLVFTPVGNNNIDTTIGVAIDDGDEDVSGPLTGTITLDVTPVNDAPTATNLTSTSPYNEGDASVAITDIVVSDVDTGETITATLTLANTATGRLSANDGATYTAGTGVWTITDTVANVNTALANLVFTPVGNNDIDTTIGVAIDDGDEDVSGPLTGTITLDVTPANDAPTATNLSSTNPYNEGRASVAITDIVVSDVDTGEAITATLTLANTAIGSLSANDGATYTAATGVWTITGTVANVNTALANLVFAPVSNNDQDTTIAVAIDDGDEDASGPLTGTVTLDVAPAAVGGAVSTLVPGAQNTSEDTTLVFSTAGGNAVIVGDRTAGDPVLRTQLSVTNGILTLNTTAGLAFENGADGTSSMTITGLESAINTALDGLTFTPAPNYAGPANLQITTDLQAGLQGYYTFTQPGALGQDSSPGGANSGVPSGPGAAPAPHAVFNSDRGSDALVLDGVDDNIRIAGRFGTPSSLTLAAWVNVAAVNSQEVISIGNSIALRVNDAGSGNGVTGFFNNGSNWQHTDSNQFIGGDGWHHVAFTLDNASNTQIIYIDGFARGTTGHSGSINWVHDHHTTIGSHTDQSGFWLNGMLDDARVYDRVLGTGEIQALANNRANDTAVVSITVDPANHPPTLTLNNTVPLLAENTDTTTRIKVADIAVADDGLGSNMLSLAGSDAALFEIDSGALYLQAGVLLDFEAHNRLEVTVLVDDSSVAGSPDDSTDFALAVDDVNEAPVVSFSGNGVDENTDTTGGYVVGRLSASDPDLGDLATFTVVGGADQDRFSIRGGNELVFNDGVLDFEKQAAYKVTVRATDAGNLQQTQTITITVNDLNEPIPFPNVGEITTSLVSAVKNTDSIVIDANTFSVATVNTTIVEPGTSSLTSDPLPGRSASTQAVAEEGTTTDELATVEEDIFSDGVSDSRFIDAAPNRPIDNLNAGVQLHGKNISLNAGVQQPGKNINLKQLVKAIANLNPVTKLLAETATSLEGAFDITSLDSYSILDNGSFHNDLDDFRNEVQAEARHGQTIVGSAVAASTGISVGYVVWLVRGGVVLSSVVSSLPAWRLIDPLPVLATVLGSSQDEEDGESLASMLEPEDPENDEDGPNEE